jgi:hypothetical protein
MRFGITRSQIIDLFIKDCGEVLGYELLGDRLGILRVTRKVPMMKIGCALTLLVVLV